MYHKATQVAREAGRLQLARTRSPRRPQVFVFAGGVRLLGGPLDARPRTTRRQRLSAVAKSLLGDAPWLGEADVPSCGTRGPGPCAGPDRLPRPSWCLPRVVTVSSITRVAVLDGDDQMATPPRGRGTGAAWCTAHPPGRRISSRAFRFRNETSRFMHSPRATFRTSACAGSSMGESPSPPDTSRPCAARCGVPLLLELRWRSPGRKAASCCSRRPTMLLDAALDGLGRHVPAGLSCFTPALKKNLSS